MALSATQYATIKLNARALLSSNSFERGASLGYVGTRTQVNSAAAGITNPYAFRFPFFATDDVSGTLSVAWSNWYGGESDPVSTMTLEAYLEYPVGVLTRIMFGGGPMVVGGSTIGTAPSKTNIWGSCAVPGTIPFGTLCFLRYYQRGSAQFLWNTATPPNVALGEACIANSTTLIGSMVSVNTEMFRPSAIVGMTRRKSYAIIGDSVQAGAGGAANSPSPGNIGSIARGLGPGIGYANFGLGSSLAVEWPLAHALRDEIINPYAYGVLCGLGTNDLYLGHVSAATLKARLQAVRALYLSKPFWAKTVDPVTTSGNNWQDLLGQTAYADQPARATLLDDMRSNPSDYGTGIIDAAAFSESAATGKWIVTGAANYATADGIHPSEAMYQLYSFPGFGGVIP